MVREMKNIKIIKTGIDVSSIQKQIDQYPEDWGNVGHKSPDNSVIKTNVLQLIIGGVSEHDEFIGNSEISLPTESIKRHTEIQHFLTSNFKSVCRCAFLKTPIGQVTGHHYDRGKYYVNKDRYHLSISGTYSYTVWDNLFYPPLKENDGVKETIDVEPGTLFWFNNKKNHMAINTSQKERIAFIFDTPKGSLKEI